MQDFPVYRKIDELLNNKIYPILTRFPKAEKYSLCQQIKNTFYDMLRYSVLAYNSTKNKAGYIEEIEGNQKLALVLLGVAYRQKYITERKLLELQKDLEEIGRMIGGWIKKTNKN